MSNIRDTDKLLVNRGNVSYEVEAQNIGNVRDSDTFLVNRNNQSFQCSMANINNVRDSDLVLVNRSGVSYRGTGADLKGLMTPPYGQSWNQIDFSDVFFQSVAYGYVAAENRYRWVAVGSNQYGRHRMYWSDDAYNWNDVSATIVNNEISPLSVASAGSGFMMCGSKPSAKNIAQSDDGKHWQMRTPTTNQGALVSITYSLVLPRAQTDSYIFFSIGHPSTLCIFATTDKGTLIRPVNFDASGTQWGQRNWTGGAVNGNRIVVGSQNGQPNFGCSTDNGDTWPTSQWSDQPNQYHSTRCINWDGSKFISYGQNGGDGSNGYIMSSTDGINWTNHGQDDLNPTGVATDGNGFWLAVSLYAYSRSRVKSSKDGINWTELPDAPPVSFMDLAFGDGKFVAVGGRPGADNGSICVTSG